MNFSSPISSPKALL